MRSPAGLAVLVLVFCWLGFLTPCFAAKDSGFYDGALSVSTQAGQPEAREEKTAEKPKKHLKKKKTKAVSHKSKKKAQESRHV